MLARLAAGFSIGPQATSIHTPQRPFRVLGRFYNFGGFFLIGPLRFVVVGLFATIRPVPRLAVSAEARSESATLAYFAGRLPIQELTLWLITIG